MSDPKKKGIGWGALPLMLFLPPLVYYMWICVTRYDGAFAIPTSRAELARLVSYVSPPSLRAVAIYLGWFGFQALLQILAPGKVVEGTELGDGTRLQYKMNGWFSFWFTWVCLGGLVYFKVISPTLLYDEFGPLLSTVNLFAFGMSCYLFIHGKVHPDTGRITGNPAYDYFMGTSLNPRIGSFDWKFFCEARPGLIGWTVINASLLFKQYSLYGHVTAPLCLVAAFQMFYIVDYFFHEEAILTTMDIKHENFGFMLCWGDLVWVPFTYSLQGFYLLQHSPEWPWWALSAIAVLNIAGYYLFRSANIQKHRFRRDPTRPIWGRVPEAMATARGTMLLLSGWWGIGRHVNYLGDLMMGLAWCLLTGFNHLLPYFFIIYFTILLVVRERRDHDICAARYGDDWKRYCERVPYRILPGIY